MYGGYVLKYIGDAVLAFFVTEDNPSDDVNFINNGNPSDDNIINSVQYTNAIRCAYTMIRVMQEGINPILSQYDYPELKARVGIDLGEVAVVQYGTDIDEFEKITIKKPHLDLIGYTVSIAVKMTGLAKPDNIVIGQKLFDKLDSHHKDLFKQLPENHDIWSYSHGVTGKIYNLYGSYSNSQ
jgi:class 3 adenylate cyclase